MTKNGSELKASGPFFISPIVFDLLYAHPLTLLLIGSHLLAILLFGSIEQHQIVGCHIPLT
jgi:hypothetical protein